MHDVPAAVALDRHEYLSARGGSDVDGVLPRGGAVLLDLEVDEVGVHRVVDVRREAPALDGAELRSGDVAARPVGLAVDRPHLERGPLVARPVRAVPFRVRQARAEREVEVPRPYDVVRVDPLDRREPLRHPGLVLGPAGDVEAHDRAHVPVTEPVPERHLRAGGVLREVDDDVGALGRCEGERGPPVRPGQEPEVGAHLDEVAAGVELERETTRVAGVEDSHAVARRIDIRARPRSAVDEHDVPEQATVESRLDDAVLDGVGELGVLAEGPVADHERQLPVPAR